MSNQSPDVAKLSESLVDELVGVFGLPKNKFTHGLFWRLFRGITDRLAGLGVNFDQLISEGGLSAGSAWALAHFCTQPRVSGSEMIPMEGPLLVAINHPGAYDALVVSSVLQRKDLAWITSDIPFFKHLPNAIERIFISTKKDSSHRMLVMRKAIRHLRSGGSLMYVAAGHREPDPAVYPGAHESIANWLDVYEMFYRAVPNLKVMPAIMSGMITPKWASHPLTVLRRKQRDKQRLSEFGQVIGQLLKPGKLLVTPNLSFGQPFSELDLRAEVGGGKLLPPIIRRSQALLGEHCAIFSLDKHH